MNLRGGASEQALEGVVDLRAEAVPDISRDPSSAFKQQNTDSLVSESLMTYVLRAEHLALKC